MKKRGPGPIEDSLNVVLHIVLMMSTDPRKAPELTLVVTISNPFFGGEGMVVRGIVLGFDAVITQKCFKGVFALERLSGCQVCLMFMENKICCVVNEYSASDMLSGFVFLAQCVSQLTKSGRHVLITRDAIIRLEVASSEESFSEGGA